MEVELHLVPSADWPPGDERGISTLPSGRVFLYREGSYAPEIVLDAGKPGRLPPGKWVWIAESDEGYVSVEAGTIAVPDNPEEQGVSDEPRRIYWPVEPACRLALDSSRDWSSVQRLDVVSESHAAVYPVDPRRRRQLWAPVGRLLTYSVGSRGLQGIDDVGGCEHRETIAVHPPAPPDAAHQEFLVTAIAPLERADELEREPLEAALAPPSGGRSTTPVARVLVGTRAGVRVSFFFLEVPAGRDLELTVRHPALRTEVSLVEELGGSARELPEQHLRERLDLPLEVDYQPLRDHRLARVDVYHCGREQGLGPRPASRCEPLECSFELRPGLRTYTLESLDDGQYYLEAWIDDQVLPGLGIGTYPYLDPDAEMPPVLDRALLHEFEVHGTLRHDGEPIPGEVRLLPLSFRDRTLPARRFRTAPDLEYRLTYFGRLPGRYEKPPGFDPGNGPEERLGLYGEAQIAACARWGGCRLYAPHSVLQGGGRLDFDLGRPARVVVEVVDAESGRPVEGARVFTRRPAKALYFHHGEVEWFEPNGREGVHLITDAEGVARLIQPGSGGNEMPLSVQHAEYDLYRGSMELVPGEENRVRVALEKLREGRTGTRLVFPDGAPVKNAFVLALEEDGIRDGGCSRPASPQGLVDLPDRCRYGHTLVVLAPGARITTLEGASFGSFERVELPRAPARSLRLRVMDEDGRPVPDAPVVLRIASVTLTPNDLLMATTFTGYQPFYLTDERGELVLRGVDPTAVTVPEVALFLGEERRWTPLDAYEPGETVTLTVPSE